MKKIFLFLVSMLVVCNMCFANYGYKTFIGKNGAASMVAPSHWIQYNTGMIGNSSVLIDLKAPDNLGSAVVMRNEELFPYNDFNEMSERDINLYTLNEVGKMQEKYPSSELLAFNYPYSADKKRLITFVMVCFFPSGKYFYTVSKYVSNRHVISSVVMAHDSIYDYLNSAKMLASVRVNP